MKTRLLENMTWTEIREAMEAGNRTVIIPAASIEQHGPHLAEITDTAIGLHTARDLAERLGDALVAPVIRPALSKHHVVLPGSLTLRPEIFAGVLEDYIDCYIRHGFENIVVISSHGGNFSAIGEIVDELAPKKEGVQIIAGYPLDVLLNAMTESEAAEGMPTGVCGGHACDWETSVMLHLQPEHVRMERAVPGFVGKPSDEVIQRLFAEGVTAISPVGVLGDPTQADATRGKRYYEAYLDRVYGAIKEKLGR